VISAQDLLPGVMHVESGGKPDAVSPKGAIGLYQVMPTTGAMYGVPREALFHPEVNRMVATRYLDDLLQHYQGNASLALAAYNTGPHNVDRGIFPAETRAYVRNVFSALGQKISSMLPERVAPELPGGIAEPEKDEVADAGEPEPEVTGDEEKPSVSAPSGGRPARPVRPRVPTLGVAQPGFLQKIEAMLNEDDEEQA
jgi:hypothetical protein